jgi:hydroxymethylpyrimidine pyrophosphatase-like HAD family hydrolase
MITHNSKIIAIDFDGTIVEDEYPRIGKPIIFAFETMLQLQKEGNRLILWTYRDGETLQEAINFCLKNGIQFYAINKNYAEEEFNEKTRRKIKADIFIDDRNVGGFLGWTAIYKLLTTEKAPELLPKKKSFFGFGK